MMTIVQKTANLSIPLIAGVLVALIWANLDFEGYYGLIHHRLFAGVDGYFVFNDVFMAFFFGLAGVEIVQSMSVGGNLYPLKKALPILLATLGGVVGPVTVFFAFNHVIGSPAYTHGWAIPTATDVAISLLFIRMIFKSGHPAISFLLLLAVLDDGIGMMIIAMFYPDAAHSVQYGWLVLVALAIVTAIVFKKKGVGSYWYYLLVPGVMAWAGLFMAGLHASLALIFIISFVPSLHKFETDFKLFVDYGLFFFGITNAGVMLSDVSDLTLIIFLSLLIGKTVGIFGMANLSRTMGLELPNGIGNRELVLIGLVAGIGLTVSLFITSSAYADLGLQASAKMGALLSVISGFVAVGLGKMWGKFI